jgi:hypothetical protein
VTATPEASCTGHHLEQQQLLLLQLAGLWVLQMHLIVHLLPQQKQQRPQVTKLAKLRVQIQHHLKQHLALLGQLPGP